jgi:transposase-like protein
MSDALKDYANTEIPTSEIATKYRVSPSTLTVWAKKAKVPLRGRGRSKLKQPNARTREILELAEVMVLEDVGGRFGMSKQRVAKIVKRWKDWKRPRQSPFVPEDVILWKGKYYTVLEGGLHFGKVKDEKGLVIHNFYWNMQGSLALKVDAESMAQRKLNGQHKAKPKVKAKAKKKK